MSSIVICTSKAKGRTKTVEVAEPFMTGIIDPDWPYTVAPGVAEIEKKTEGSGKLSGFTRNPDTSQNQYKQKIAFSIEELGNLPIGRLIGGYIFMWTVSPFLITPGQKSLPNDHPSAALYLLERWGFEPCTMLTWAKYNLDRIRKQEKSGGYGGVGFWALGNANL